MKNKYPSFLKAEEFGSMLTIEATAEVILEASDENGKPKQPTFDMVAYSGGVLNVGYSRYPVYVDLSGLNATEDVVILFNHDRSNLVGQGVATISAKQCNVSGKITGNWENEDTPAGAIVMHARNGFKWPVSIGAEVSEVEELRANQKTKVNGRSVKGPAIIVKSGTLREVSFVTIGGDKKASANIAASAVKENVVMKTFEQYVAACGKKIEDLSDKENLALQAAYDALKAAGILDSTVENLVKASAPAVPAAVVAPQKLEASADTSIAEGVAEIKAEAKRIAGINAALKNHPELIASAIDENWTVDKAEVQAELTELRANRAHNVPGILTSTGKNIELNAEIATAAISMQYNIDTRNAGERLVAKHGQETVNKAEEMRHLRFSQMMDIICTAQGIDVPTRIGSSEWVQAVFSGSSIGSTILGNVANKQLASVIAEPNWIAPLISAPASHANFHTHTVYSMAVNGDLEVISPTGEVEAIDMSNESWTRQLKTRGALLSITRQDFINDDLSVFSRNASTLARKAMNAREKALFTVINATGAGSSHFTATRGNYLSGESWGHDELGRMIKVFRNMTGPDGDPALIEPAILLVTPTNEEESTRMLASGGMVIATGLASTSEKTIEANKNIYGGRFGGSPIVGPYLENANLTGYSTTATYLLADPAIQPCFEIAYLNGQQSPTIEYFGVDTDPSILGITWRVYYDVAASTAEYRAGVKSAGA